MTSQRILTPGPDHPITVTPNPRRVVVRVGDIVVADTRRALTLREASYPPVQYVPREDADMARLLRSDHASHCPYKGDAGYFHLAAIGERGANAVWTYETPHAAVAAIVARAVVAAWGSEGAANLAPSAWTIITDRPWATMSCISRAIRCRSASASTWTLAACSAS